MGRVADKVSVSKKTALNDSVSYVPYNDKDYDLFTLFTMAGIHSNILLGNKHAPKHSFCLLLWRYSRMFCSLVHNWVLHCSH